MRKISRSVKRFMEIIKIMLNRTLLSIVILAIFGWMTTVSAEDRDTVYVDQQADGAEDGTSWGDAHTELQDALEALEDIDTEENPVDIWVAEGTYDPQPGADENNVDRTSTFKIREGINLYGGFDGSETDLNQRDWEAHETILSGQLLEEPDEFLGETNAYTVISIESIGTEMILDGLIIEKGRSVDPEDTDVAPQNRGGGIYIANTKEEENLHVKHSSIHSNEARENGGGIYVSGDCCSMSATIHLKNSNLTDNLAVNDGGGIYIDYYNTFIVKGGVLSNNIAEENGGAVYSGENTNMRVNNTKIEENVAKNRSGGGIYLRGRRYNVEIESVEFKNNKAGWNSQSAAFNAEYTSDSYYKISKSSFINDGIRIWRGDSLHIEDSRFEALDENIRIDIVDDQRAKIKQTKFVGSSEYYTSLNMDNSSAFISHSIFKNNNTSNYDTPLIYHQNAEGQRLTFTNSEFVNNSNRVIEEGDEYFSGNLIANENGIIRLINSLAVDNKFEDLITTSGSQSDVEVVNSTFADNKGDVIVEEGDLRISNSIFWSNDGAMVNNDFFGVRHSVMEQIPDNIDANLENVFEDPQFVNPVENDYRLTQVSPAIDIGLNTALTDTIETDLAGNSRFYDGNDDGEATVDAGAYEWDGELFPPENIVLHSPADGQEDVAFSPEFEWEANLLADTYELRVAADSSFDESEIIIEAAELDTSYYEAAEELGRLETYYWQVRGANEQGTGAWSEFYRFTTMPDGPFMIADPVELDFETIPDTDSLTLEVTLYNEGDDTLEVTPNITEGGSVYNLRDGEEVTVPPEASEAIAVQFDGAGELGTFTGQLELQHNAGNEESPYTIALTGEETDEVISVYPGDTNNDGIVSAADILPIGQCYGETGPRAPDSYDDTEWNDYNRVPWDNTDCTYADAGGTGVVDVADVLVIGRLYGSETETDTESILAVNQETEAQSEVGILRIVASESEQNDEVPSSFRVKLDADQEIYGLSFELDYHVESGKPLVFSKEPDYGDGIFSDALGLVHHETDDTHIAGGFSFKSDDGFTGEDQVISFELDAGHENIEGRNISFQLKNIAAVDGDGNTVNIQSDGSFELTPTGTEDLQNVPQQVALKQNYPNPFNPATVIEYAVPEEAQVTLEVFDVVGQRLATLVDEEVTAGQYEVEWDAGNLSSGVYLYRLTYTPGDGSSQQQLTRQMTLVK